MASSAFTRSINGLWSMIHLATSLETLTGEKRKRFKMAMSWSLKKEC